MKRVAQFVALAACLSAIAPTITKAEPQSDDANVPAPARFPGVFGIPSAFPAPGGTGYAGLVLVHPRRGSQNLNTTLDNLDGDIVLGYTLGHPVHGVSVTLGTTITSLKGFGKDGAFQISLSRALMVHQSSLTFAGVSAFNIGAWGDATNSPPGYAAYVSHLTALPFDRGEMPVQITIGYGDQVAPAGRRRSYDRVAFAGVGFGLSKSVNVSLAATPKEIYAGFGFGFEKLPLWSFSFGAYDLTQNQGRRQLALTVARSF